MDRLYRKQASPVAGRPDFRSPASAAITTRQNSGPMD
jgi:hypothetical protein